MTFFQGLIEYFESYYSNSNEALPDTQFTTSNDRLCLRVIGIPDSLLEEHKELDDIRPGLAEEVLRDYYRNILDEYQ